MDDLEVVDTPNPSGSTSMNDCRINCTNSENLRNILDITVKYVSELVDAPNLKENSSEFIKQFTDVYQKALQENVVINGFPWVLDKNKLTSPEKEDHKHMVDDTVLNQLSQTVTQVAKKRKAIPFTCHKIHNIKMKHNIQNLKRTEDISKSSSLSPPKSFNRDRRHIEKFSDFCKNFNSIQQNVQEQLTEREKITRKINVASTIQTRQRTILRSIADDETVALKKS